MTNLNLTAEEIKLIEEKRAEANKEATAKKVRVFEMLASRRDKGVAQQLASFKRIEAIKDEFIKTGKTLVEKDLRVVASANSIYISDEAKEVLDADKLEEYETFRYMTYSLRIGKRYIDIRDGKVNCYGIQGDFRYVKVSTLAEKIVAQVKQEEREKTRAEKELELGRAEVKALAEKYPNHTSITLELTTGEYVPRGNGRGGYRKDDYYVIEIVFKSGSRIKFRLQTFVTDTKAECTKIIVSKRDSDYRADRTPEEWLERFNNQK